MWVLAGGSLLPPSLAILRNVRSYVYISVVKEATPPTAPENPDRNRERLHVLGAALEHTIPERGVKVSAGGLGKVLDQMLREHPPGELSLIHPLYGDVEYGELVEFDVIYCVIDIKQEEVLVYTIESEVNGIRRKWYLLDHELFRSQSQTQPYPSPMTKLRTLKYFSLWNQAVAELIALLRPDVYHCMDYHAALAPLYLPEHKQVAMILVLHNGDYMGVIETDFISDRFWKTVKQLRRLTLLFNLSEQTIRDYLIFEGRLNMLRAGVQYIVDTQEGWGICAVSDNYAKELKRERALFSDVPGIMALDNATDPSDDAGRMSRMELQERRSAARAALQRQCGLNVSGSCKVLIFLGRWVKQKGVDTIALLTPALLRAFPDVQLVLVGPAGDSHGLYAQELLEPMVEEFPGRLFVKTTFFKMSAEVRAGADFCFAPSISEPFGYVDVEFGLLGVPTIGCAVGGLGKMPGVYFRQQNSDSSEAFLHSFYSAIDFALRHLSEDDYWAMAEEGIKAAFPFDTWRENLQEAYTQALVRFQPSLGRSRPGRSSIGSFFAHGAHLMMSSVVAAVVHSRNDNEMGEVTGVVADMRRMDIDDEAEFLAQDVSEQRTHNILRRSMMRAAGDRRDAAALAFYIFQADQRQSEHHQVTLWLMRPFKPLASNGRCMNIHVVVALGFIFFPVGLSTISAAAELAEDTTESRSLQQTFYLGVAVGSVLWVLLSHGIPPNLLMSLSQCTNIMLIFLAYSGLPHWSLYPVHFSFGLQSASRLLFAIWNFGEDFQGGFETITKRIALWESLRICADGLLVFIASSGLPLLANLIRVAVSLAVLSLLVAAPRAYSTFVLPQLGWLEGLGRRSYWLLLASQSLSSLAWSPGLSSLTWWSFGGWDAPDTNLLVLFANVLACVAVFGAFMCIQGLTVWGPWPMRDFVCLVPPGSLLAIVAVYVLSPGEERRSATFAVSLFVATVLDAARDIAIFSSMLTIVGSKWYAIKGGFLSFMVTSVCTAMSPLLLSLIASLMQSREGRWLTVVGGEELVGRPGLVMLAVAPCALLSYLFQLASLLFFNEDILTYKGHGVFLPDGRRDPPTAVQHRLSLPVVSQAQESIDHPLPLSGAMSRESSWALCSDTHPIPDTGSRSMPSIGHLPIGAVGPDQVAHAYPLVPRGPSVVKFPEERVRAMVPDRAASSVSSASFRRSSSNVSSVPPRVPREAVARAPTCFLVMRRSGSQLSTGSVSGRPPRAAPSYRREPPYRAPTRGRRASGGADVM